MKTELFHHPVLVSLLDKENAFTAGSTKWMFSIPWEGAQTTTCDLVSGEQEPGFEYTLKRHQKKHGLYIQGLEGSKYIHRDIHVPYGEELHETGVREALQEIQGEAYQPQDAIFWNTYYQEDTPQGTKHRVFISIVSGENILNEREGAIPDVQVPVELGMFAWTPYLERKFGSTFHFVLQTKLHWYSLLFFQGTPFHLLQLESSEQTLDPILGRLEEHVQFMDSVMSSTEKESLKHIFCGDSSTGKEFARQWNQVHHWSFYGDETSDSCAASLEKYPGEAHLAMGLVNTFQTSQGDEWKSFNRQPYLAQRKKEWKRDFIWIQKVSLWTLCVCTVLWLSLQGWNWIQQRELNGLQEKEQQYHLELSRIQELRKKQHQLQKKLQGLGHVRKENPDWRVILDAVAKAVDGTADSTSGILRWHVMQKSSVLHVLHLKGWSSSYSKVSAIHKELEGYPYFKNVEIPNKKSKKEKVLFELKAEF